MDALRYKKKEHGTPGCSFILDHQLLGELTVFLLGVFLGQPLASGPGIILSLALCRHRKQLLLTIE